MSKWAPRSTRNTGRTSTFAHGDPNAEGHIFGLLHGCTVLVLVEKGKIKVGTNQKIIFFEASGPREDRKIWVDWFRK